MSSKIFFYFLLDAAAAVCYNSATGESDVLIWDPKGETPPLPPGGTSL